jgi:hypothetical protein
LAAKATGCCDLPTAEYPCLVRVNAADPGCAEFSPRHPARRRRIAPVAPSADAQAIANSITAGFERLTQTIERAFTNPEGSGTAWDALSDLVTITERIADATD